MLFPLFKTRILPLAISVALFSACSQQADYGTQQRMPNNMSDAAVAAAESVEDYSKMGMAAENTEQYGKIETNPVQAVAQNPVSTFSIDVDTGSYANTRRFLNDGSLPPVDAVRLEEMINYFDYQYPQPTNNQPFAVHTETVDSPWQTDAKIIKIGIQAKDWAQAE